jgi:hypothetical protein
MTHRLLGLPEADALDFARAFEEATPGSVPVEDLAAQ